MNFEKLNRIRDAIFQFYQTTGTKPERVLISEQIYSEIQKEAQCLLLYPAEIKFEKRTVCGTEIFVSNDLNPISFILSDHSETVKKAFYFS